MQIEQVALQLYTLRDQLRTPDEIRRGLKKVAEIGYRAVENAGLPIQPGELRQILQGEGLTLCSAHGDLQAILSDPEKASEDLQALGCRHVVYAYPAGIDLANPAVVEKFAENLNRSGQVFQEAGQGLAYHNHAIELLRMNGQTVLEYLYGQTDARYLQAEIDTYWIQYGGGDPAAWCEQLKGRLPLLHMKDYQMLATNQPAFAEIGYGNLSWKKILAAAEASGCEWFIVEQDTCPGDPFDSVRKSFDYIRANLV